MNSHDVQRTSWVMHRQGPTLVQVLKIKKFTSPQGFRVLAGEGFEVILV